MQTKNGEWEKAFPSEAEGEMKTMVGKAVVH